MTTAMAPRLVIAALLVASLGAQAAVPRSRELQSQQHPSNKLRAVGSSNKRLLEEIGVRRMLPGVPDLKPITQPAKPVPARVEDAAADAFSRVDKAQDTLGRRLFEASIGVRRMLPGVPDLKPITQPAKPVPARVEDAAADAFSRVDKAQETLGRRRLQAKPYQDVVAVRGAKPGQA